MINWIKLRIDDMAKKKQPKRPPATTTQPDFETVFSKCVSQVNTLMSEATAIQIEFLENLPDDQLQQWHDMFAHRQQLLLDQLKQSLYGE